MVEALWPTLVQFLLRLIFGLTVAMGITPSRWVTSGFYRVHLWVAMGLATFASLAVYSQWSWYGENAVGAPNVIFTSTVLIAVVAYVGAIIWMYEQAALGQAALWLCAALAVVAGWTAFLPASSQVQWLARALNWLSAGSTLGLFLAAMFLGHWYLNWPGMKLDPLRRLVIFCGCSLILRAALAGWGVAASPHAISSMLLFRWLAGIVGPAVMAYMTWLTLKIPNTQSATGILYAAVILTFLGELTSQFLSRGLPLPV